MSLIDRNEVYLKFCISQNPKQVSKTPDFKFSYRLSCLFYDRPSDVFRSISDELVAEKERYKEIGDDLDTAFVELIL